MKTINHEGQEYILKSEVDTIVRDRLAKTSEAKRHAEKQIKELQTQLQNVQNDTETNTNYKKQVEDLEVQLKKTNQKYERHTAIANEGITDPDIRDLVEWQYEKTMSSRAKKDVVQFTEWMQQLKNTDNVPKTLAPYFSKNEALAQQNTVQTSPEKEVYTEAIRPTTNSGVSNIQQQNTNGDVWKKAATDYEFFRQNREALKKQYYQERNNRFKQ
tara:strand:- start:32 stop:676 length:645 start_codon:yes stop_codon:yes gene_type:complete